MTKARVIRTAAPAPTATTRRRRRPDRSTKTGRACLRTVVCAPSRGGGAASRSVAGTASRGDRVVAGDLFMSPRSAIPLSPVSHVPIGRDPSCLKPTRQPTVCHAPPATGHVPQPVSWCQPSTKINGTGWCSRSGDHQAQWSTPGGEYSLSRGVVSTVKPAALIQSVVRRGPAPRVVGLGPAGGRDLR
jgi:hypothetical protein